MCTCIIMINGSSSRDRTWINLSMTNLIYWKQIEIIDSCNHFIFSFHVWLYSKSYIRCIVLTLIQSICMRIQNMKDHCLVFLLIFRRSNDFREARVDVIYIYGRERTLISYLFAFEDFFFCFTLALSFLLLYAFRFDNRKFALNTRMTCAFHVYNFTVTAVFSLVLPYFIFFFLLQKFTLIILLDSLHN